MFRPQQAGVDTKQCVADSSAELARLSKAVTNVEDALSQRAERSWVEKVTQELSTVLQLTVAQHKALEEQTQELRLQLQELCRRCCESQHVLPSISEVRPVTEAACGAAIAALTLRLDVMEAGHRAAQPEARERKSQLARIDTTLQELTTRTANLENADQRQRSQIMEDLQHGLAEERRQQTLQISQLLQQLEALQVDFRSRLNRPAGEGQSNSPTEEPPSGVFGHVGELRSVVTDLQRRHTPAAVSKPDEEGGALWQAVQVIRSQTERLQQELAEERRERHQDLAEVRHVAEDVAQAAKATISRAGKKFTEELALDSQTTRAAAPSSGPDVVRLVGEMDAELRVELSSRVRLLAAEVRGEVAREAAMRASSTDARVGALEAQSGVLCERLARLETGQLSARIPRRDLGLERMPLQPTELDKGVPSSPRVEFGSSPSTSSTCVSASATSTNPTQLRASSTPALPDTLKESLEDVVAAVYRTLGQSPKSLAKAHQHSPSRSNSATPRDDSQGGSSGLLEQGTACSITQNPKRALQQRVAATSREVTPPKGLTTRLGARTAPHSVDHSPSRCPVVVSESTSRSPARQTTPSRSTPAVRRAAAPAAILSSTSSLLYRYRAPQSPLQITRPVVLQAQPASDTVLTRHSPV